jgi:hypothetical protein
MPGGKSPGIFFACGNTHFIFLVAENSCIPAACGVLPMAYYPHLSTLAPHL